MKLIRDNEEGSGCAGRRHYFDYIDVDDEDYVDGSGLGIIQEYVSEGPPIIEDSLEDQSDREKDITIMPTTPEPIKMVPEQLVLTNETHGSLNGRFIVPNNVRGHEQNIIVIDQVEDVNNEAQFDRNIEEGVGKVMHPAISRSCVIKMDLFIVLCSLMKLNL